MTPSALKEWLKEPRPALIAAVADGTRAYVDMLRSRGIEFYGFALLPGEPYDIHSLVAAFNTEADIKIPRSDSRYIYYRYSVDEWCHYDREGFAAANALLDAANIQFKTMHTKAADDIVMDEFEIAHANALLYAIVQGLETAKAGGVFGSSEPFLVVWIADSDDEVVVESARRLNSATVVEEFMREFGS